MTSKSFNDFLKEERGEKYVEDLDVKLQQEIDKHKDEECVYVKNSEDYATYKPKSLVSADDIIISEKEYNELVGNKIKKLMKYKGYTGSIEFSEEDNCLFGKVQGIRGLISYEGESLKELKDGFHYMIDEYLEDCKNEGIDPQKPY